MLTRNFVFCKFMTTRPTKSDLSGSRLLAIEIGGSKLQVCAGDAHGQIIARERRAINPAHGAVGIRAQLSECLESMLPAHRPVAIGVGYGGPVNWRTGVIVRSHHISGWDGFNLAEWLQKLCGIPVCVENDANVAALGESRFGAGRGADTVFYVTVGSGVGGGLVSDGRIFHGASPGEAEIGHLRLDEARRTTEKYASGWSLNRRIREAIVENPDSILAARVKSEPGHEARHLGPALAAGDALAQQILDEAAARLAHALSHVTHLFHPDVIVLGGGVALMGNIFRSAVARHLPPLLMDAFQPGPRIALSTLREDAVPAGALALAADFLVKPPSKPLEFIMKEWLQTYISAQHRALDSVPLDGIARLIETLRSAWRREGQIFAIGNGGSAANASHFTTDLGKGASDKVAQRFRVLSLTDNAAWLTALGNDYCFDDVFVRQLQNFARPGDVLVAASVSGNSPNLVKAFEWANENGIETAVIVGAKRGKLAEIATQTIVVNDTHYGRVEDVQMHILHMVCYAFMEIPQLTSENSLAAKQ